MEATGGGGGGSAATVASISALAALNPITGESAFVDAIWAVRPIGRPATTERKSRMIPAKTFGSPLGADSAPGVTGGCTPGL
jgi:hypothetical protein